jgi:hypothetical protein
MLDGLRVFVDSVRQSLVCPAHPSAPLETGTTAEGDILWKCSRCLNSAHWPNEAARAAEIAALAAQATSRR